MRESGGRRREETRCFRCLGFGHWAVHCRDPVKCRACGGCGHKAFSCPEQRKKMEIRNYRKVEVGIGNKTPAVGESFEDSIDLREIEGDQKLGEFLKHCAVCHCPGWEETDLQNFLSKQWRTSSRWWIRRMYGGDYLVQFPNNQWRTQAIESKNTTGVQWKRWEKKTAAWEVDRGQRIWMDIIGVPLDMWNERCIRRITGSFGNLLEIHGDTVNGKNLESIRAWVEVPFGLKIPSKLRLKCQEGDFRIGIHCREQMNAQRTWVEVCRNVAEDQERAGDRSPERSPEGIPMEAGAILGNYNPEISGEIQGTESIRKLNLNSTENSNLNLVTDKADLESINLPEDSVPKNQQDLLEWLKEMGESIYEIEEGDSPDPFQIWKLLGGNPKRKKRLWERVGHIMEQEFKALSLNAQQGKGKGEISEAIGDEVKDSRSQVLNEEEGSEKFMQELRDTEGERTEDDRRGSETELYSPSDNIWSMENTIKRGSRLGIQGLHKPEKFMKAWADKIEEEEEEGNSRVNK